MRQYEVNFIVDPVLSGDEIKEAAQTYVNLIQEDGNKIVNVDEMGLRQLAYPIKKRTTGMYYCVEYQNDNPEFIPKMELAFRRDERIMRFLNVKLDRHGVEYNDKKRKGLIGKKGSKQEQVKKEIKEVKKKAVAPVAPKAKSEEE